MCGPPGQVAHLRQLPNSASGRKSTVASDGERPEALVRHRRLDPRQYRFDTFRRSFDQ